MERGQQVNQYIVEAFTELCVRETSTGVMGDNEFDLEEMMVVLKVCSGTAGAADGWMVWEREIRCMLVVVVQILKVAATT